MQYSDVSIEWTLRMEDLFTIVLQILQGDKRTHAIFQCEYYRNPKDEK